MAYMYLGLNRTATITLAIVEKLLVAILDGDIGPKPVTLPTTTQVTMLKICDYLLLLDVSMKFFMIMKKVIVRVIMEDVESGLKRLAARTFKITEKVLMVMVEVDIGLVPDPLPSIIQVRLVYYLVFRFMVMRLDPA